MGLKGDRYYAAEDFFNRVDVNANFGVAMDLQRAAEKRAAEMALKKLAGFSDEAIQNMQPAIDRLLDEE